MVDETNPPNEEDAPLANRRLLCIGAHPDDAEFHAGGLMTQWHAAGGTVHILCMTDGSAGHQHMDRAALAARRLQEATAAAELIGAQLEIFDIADGALQADLPTRGRLISAIRNCRPDLIVTHRPADYHPDHRATAQLVQDACYLLQVPNIEPQTPPLPEVPPVLLTADRFTYPRPFRADWIIDIGPQLPQIIDMLDRHASQVYEWLPHTLQIEVPASNRLQWLRNWYAAKPAAMARKYAASKVEFAEAYEISEYGGHFNPDNFKGINRI